MPKFLTGLFASSAGYAALLSTERGSRFADRHTWASVVIGVSLVLGWLSFEDEKAAGKAFQYFAVGGLPLVIRSLWRQLDA